MALLPEFSSDHPPQFNFLLWHPWDILYTPLLSLGKKYITTRSVGGSLDGWMDVSCLRIIYFNSIAKTNSVWILLDFGHDFEKFSQAVAKPTDFDGLVFLNSSLGKPPKLWAVGVKSLRLGWCFDSHVYFAFGEKWEKMWVGDCKKSKQNKKEKWGEICVGEWQQSWD